MIIRNAYRGVHRAGTWIDGRGLAISFSTGPVATHYATHPNNRGDHVENARVYCCDLTIRKPLLNNPHDPFISFTDLVEAIGIPNALKIYIEQKDWVCSTDMWDTYQKKVGLTYTEMLSSENWEEHLCNLDVQLYPLLDNNEYIGWFKAAGFDGAVFQGSGVGNGQPEYVIFDRTQARQIHLAYIG
jgi:hypothetical protein